MFKPVRQNAERQSFSPRNCFVAAAAVRQNTREINDFTDPAAIVFPFNLNREVAHVAMLQPIGPRREFRSG